jgi:elongation factor Ts
VPTTDVSSAIRDTIVKVGENISLRRASAITQHTLPPVLPRTLNSAMRLGSYVHGTLHGLPCGRVAGLALLNLHSPQLLKLLTQQSFTDELSTLQRAIARQIVGFETPAIRRGVHLVTDAVVEASDYGDAQPLYEQPFVTLPGEFQGLPVEEALRKWAVSSGLASEESAPGAVEVLRFLRWTVGEPLEEPSEHGKEA